MRVRTGEVARTPIGRRLRASPGASPVTDINPGVTDAHCYQYRLLLTDNVGNTRTVTGTDVTKVDTTVPTVTFNAFTEGTNPNFQYADNAAQKLWYNPAQQGDFQLAINVADVQSAEKKVDFPQLGTNWTPPLADPLLTDSSTPSPFTITYGWDGTVTPRPSPARRPRPASTMRTSPRPPGLP